MFRLMCNRLGLQVVAELLTGPEMNNDCFTTNLRAPLELDADEQGN
jgi:hypothetical protein